MKKKEAHVCSGGLSGSKWREQFRVWTEARKCYEAISWNACLLLAVVTCNHMRSSQLKQTLKLMCGAIFPCSVWKARRILSWHGEYICFNLLLSCNHETCLMLTRHVSCSPDTSCNDAWRWQMKGTLLTMKLVCWCKAMRDPLCDTQRCANVCVSVFELSIFGMNCVDRSFQFSEWKRTIFSIHKTVCGFFFGMNSNDRSFSF